MITGELTKVGRQLVHNKIAKFGWNAERFQREYGCTEAQLDEYIGIMFPRGNEADHLRSLLRKNTSKKPTNTPVGKGASAKAKNQRNTTAAKTADTSATETTNTSATEPKPKINLTKPAKKTPSLDDLKELERKLSDEIMGLEVEHKAAWEQHYECRKALAAIDDRISEIRASLESCIADYDTEIEKARKLESSMTEIRSKWRDKDKRLTEIRAEIATLTKISIMVCEDGDILCETYQLVDTGSKELYSQMVLDPELIELNLTMKEVMTIARLRRITANLPNDREVELFFDNDKLEAVFARYRDASNR